eukprot:ANDGO_06880.mRNA.1 Mitogen-activated protein kinase homolog NTF6
MCLGSHLSDGSMRDTPSFTSLANCDRGEILFFERSSFAYIAKFVGRVQSGRLASDEDSCELWMQHNVTIEGRFVNEVPSGIMKLKKCGTVECTAYRNGSVVEEIMPLSERYAAFIQQLRKAFSTDEIFRNENENCLFVVLHDGLPVCLFCVRCHIGSGAEAIVYRGLTAHHGPVAVKIFRRLLDEQTPEARTQKFFTDQLDYMGEEELFGRIPRQSTGRFPSLVRVLYIGAVDFGTSIRNITRRENALVMSYYPEGDVFGKTSQIQKSLSSIALFQQLKLLTSTVAALHEAKLIHRDIKPKNILLDNGESNGSCSFRLTDFGISSVHLEAQTYVDPSANANHYLGSPWWRPPEFVLLPALRTYRSDVFSLGWTLLYLAQVQQECMTSKYLQHACQISPDSSSDLFSSDDENHYFEYIEMVSRDMQSLREGRIEIHLRTDVHSTATSRILFSHLVSRMVAYDYSERLKMENVIAHPLFWNTKQCVQFIVDLAQPLADLFREVQGTNVLHYQNFEHERHSFALRHFLWQTVSPSALLPFSSSSLRSPSDFVLFESTLNPVSFEQALLDYCVHPKNNYSVYKRLCCQGRMCIFFVMRFIRNLACHTPLLLRVFREEVCRRYENHTLVCLLLGQCGKNGDLFGRIIEVASELSLILLDNESQLSITDRQILFSLRRHGFLPKSEPEGLLGLG